MPLQGVPYRLIRDGIPEVGQRSHNAVITPAGILFRHLHDPSVQFGFDARPARVAAVFGSIKLLSNELPVPSQNSVRLATQATWDRAFRPSRARASPRSRADRCDPRGGRATSSVRTSRCLKRATKSSSGLCQSALVAGPRWLVWCIGKPRGPADGH
jgi:hypothetical protein